MQNGTGQANPYRIQERIARLLWQFCRLTFYRPVPRAFNAWHRAVLRIFGARVGVGVTLYPSAEILMPWMLTLADHCVIGDRVRLYSVGAIVVGSHTVISQHAHLCAGTHDHADPTMPLVRAGIQVGAGCWICADAFIGPGVTVGDGAVVGARSVVVSDIPANTVAAGNPCRPLKARVLRPAPLPQPQ